MTTHQEELTRLLMDTLFRFRRSHRIHKPILGMKYGELMVLFRIKEHNQSQPKGIRVSELSSQLNVTSPSITQTINVLEHRGLVNRSIDPEDRRYIRVTLTTEGEAFAEKASRFLISLYSNLVDNLGEEKTRHLVKLLGECIEYFDCVSEVHGKGETMC